MKIREKTIHELSDLSPVEYSSVFQYILTIKANRPGNKGNRIHWFDEVRESLQGIKGDLSEDIIEARKDRL